MAKPIKSLLLFIPLLSLLFVSCSSTKEIQQSYQYLKSDLYYDLTTPVYEGEVKKTIVLKPVESSAMAPYTVVERTKRRVIPLLLYNASKEQYKVTLGEMSLNDSYLNFITEALLAEFNRSTCIQLEDTGDDVADYYLYIDIVENKTTASLHVSSSFFFFFLMEELSVEWNNCNVGKVATNLAVNVKLTDADRVVYEHSFPVFFETNNAGDSYEEIFSMNEKCLDRMAENLSEATRQLAEDISSRLHYVMILSYNYAVMN